MTFQTPSKTLHLHLRARKAVEQSAVFIIGLKELAEQDANYLPVSDHCATGFDGKGFWRVEQLRYHDWRRVDAAHHADEVGVSTFACAGRPPERINSRGNLILLRPNSPSNCRQTAPKMSCASLTSRSGELAAVATRGAPISTVSPCI